VFINKLRDIDEQVREIEKIPYVKEVISYIPTKIIYFERWIDKKIKNNRNY